MAVLGAASGRGIWVCRLFLGLLIVATSIQAQEEEDKAELDMRSVTAKGSNPDILAVDVRCHTGSMCAHIDKEWLWQQWGVGSLSQLSLRKRCDLSADETETHFILCTSEGKLMSCGNEFAQERRRFSGNRKFTVIAYVDHRGHKTNDTHVTFSNDIHILFLSSGTRLISSVKASLPWECTYPLKLLVGTQFVPEISPITIFRANQTGFGEFKGAMFLYKDEKFRHAYDSTPMLHYNDRLRVKVQLLRGPQTSRLQVFKCWATSVADPKEGDSSYTLIDDYCPTVEAARADVRLMNNGDLQHALWDSKVFRFVVNPEVYIHCHVKVCFDGADCEKRCLSSEETNLRRRREAGDPEDGLLSLGPLLIGSDVPELGENAESTLNPNNKEEAAASSDDNNLIFGMPKTVVFIIIGSLAALCVILVLGVSVALHRKTNEKRQKTTERYWKEQIATRYRLSKRFTLSNGPPFEIPISVPNTLVSQERMPSELPQ